MLKKFTKPLILLAIMFLTSPSFACTIGIANGTATSDGRPMMWKNRDAAYKDNVVWYSDKLYKYNFVAVTNAGDSYCWQGVNEKGFAILNSLSADLAKLSPYSSDNENGSYMRKALGYCDSVDEFEQLLKNTNTIGRETMANYAVMDANGNAAIFETANHQYWKFDTKDAPNGYIVRSNFAFNGDGKQGLDKNFYSLDRYKRSSKLIADFYADGKLTYKDIFRGQMRDLYDVNTPDIQIPYSGKLPGCKPGYLNTRYTICRGFSVSTSVIVGVLPKEDPRLSTMWTILGHPATTVAVPYWPIAKTPPQAFVKELVTASLCDTSKNIRSLLFDDKKNYINSAKLKDAQGNGVLKTLYTAEDKIFAQADESIANWRKTGINKKQMIQLEYKLAQDAQSTIDTLYDQLKKENK